MGLFPLYLFYSFVQHMGQNLFSGGLSDYLLFVFMFALFVIGPIFLLMFLRLIVVNKDSIKEIYIFRLTTNKYLTSELKNTFTQKMIGNSAFPFDFYQTYLYFGQERRIRFSALEFINYRTLKKKMEEIEKATCR
jgi:hypothetical protein